MTEDRRELVRANAEMLAEGRAVSPSTEVVSTPLRKAAAIVLCLVFGTVFIAELVQFHERVISDKPLWTTWLVHNDDLAFAAPLLLWWWRRRRERETATATGDYVGALEADSAGSPWDAVAAVLREPRPRWVTLGLSVIIFLCEWVWYVSLPRVSVSASLSIANSSPTFVLVLSFVILGEALTVVKLTAVLCGLLGVILISASGAPSNASGSPLVGYLTAIASALLMAVFQVAYKKWGADMLWGKTSSPMHWRDPLGSACVLLFALGFWNLVALWPFVVIGHVAGIETFAAPSATSLFSTGCIMILDAGVNVGILLAIQFSTPLFVSGGLLAVVPVALVADMIAHHYVLPAIGIIGFLLVCCGFVLLNWFGYFSPPTSPKLQWMNKEYTLSHWLHCGRNAPGSSEMQAMSVSS